MTTSPTPFLGIELPDPGSNEPFSVTDFNTMMTVIDDWAETTGADVTAATSAVDAVESGLASGAVPVSPSALNAAVPVAKGGTGGTTLPTARAGLEIYVQATQPTSTTVGAMWFWSS